jgi:hypothetical protein
MRKKQKKITVLLAPRTFSKFDRYCEEHGYKKTGLLNKMILERLEEHESNLNLSENRHKPTRKKDL